MTTVDIKTGAPLVLKELPETDSVALMQQALEILERLRKATVRDVSSVRNARVVINNATTGYAYWRDKMKRSLESIDSGVKL